MIQRAMGFLNLRSLAPWLSVLLHISAEVGRRADGRWSDCACLMSYAAPPRFWKLPL